MKGLLIAIALVSLSVLGACDLETGDGGGDGGVDAGLGSQDASGDVNVGRCDAEFEIITCEITIRNSSDGRSDYYIEATIENGQGEKVGTANTLVTGVEGGQTARDELLGTYTGGRQGLEVRLTTVQRTAS